MAKARTVTKADLNKQGCGVPNCGHDHSIVYLHGACHLSAPTWSRYEKKTETLIIECCVCKKEVIRIRL
jgi:hypothetical protein